MKRNLDSSKAELGKEIEKILTIHNDYATANENNFEYYIKDATKDLATLSSDMVEDVIGDYIGFHKEPKYQAGYNNAKKEARSRKKRWFE